MLGLLALGLTSFMIYTLVKNALLGIQVSKENTFNGTIELIIPITAKSEFFIEAWQKSVSSFHFPIGNLKVHLLIDGHHPLMSAWQDLGSKIPYLEIHNFPMRPNFVEAIPWMLEQISSKIEGQIVMIGDAELVPTESAFNSIAQAITEKKRSYFVLPQTGKYSRLGEATSVLNPTLAFASFFGHNRIRRYFTKSFLGISQGWMCMSLEVFRQLDFKSIRLSTWKEAIAKQWEEQNKTFHLAFGEKHLLRYYPENIKGMIYQLRDKWDDLWKRKDRSGFWLFLMVLFIWSFPIVCFFTHPFWSIASFFLLILYRFFSKIVFQERVSAIFLHPVGCVFWIGSFIWWLSSSLKSRYGSQATLTP